MNTDQLTINEITMVLLKEYNVDKETIINLLDKLGDQYSNWLIEWARDAFSAPVRSTCTDQNCEPVVEDLEWA